MNVKELRQTLEGLPDDATVVLECEHDGSLRYAHPAAYSHVTQDVGRTFFQIAGSYSQLVDADDRIGRFSDDDDADPDTADLPDFADGYEQVTA